MKSLSNSDKQKNCIMRHFASEMHLSSLTAPTVKQSTNNEAITHCFITPCDETNQFNGTNAIYVQFHVCFSLLEK